MCWLSIIFLREIVRYCRISCEWQRCQPFPIHRKSGFHWLSTLDLKKFSGKQDVRTWLYDGSLSIMDNAMDKYLNHNLNWTCDFLSMLRKLTHVRKRSPWSIYQFRVDMVAPPHVYCFIRILGPNEILNHSWLKESVCILDICNNLTCEG